MMDLMGYYEPEKKTKRKYKCKDHDPCKKDEKKHEKCECEDSCKGGTRWGASFLTPPSPPFPY